MGRRLQDTPSTTTGVSKAHHLQNVQIDKSQVKLSLAPNEAQILLLLSVCI